MKFKLGDLVKKVSGSQWHGTVVGTYSTELTPEGYAFYMAGRNCTDQRILEYILCNYFPNMVSIFSSRTTND